MKFKQLSLTPVNKHPVLGSFETIKCIPNGFKNIKWANDWIEANIFLLKRKGIQMITYSVDNKPKKIDMQRDCINKIKLALGLIIMSPNQSQLSKIELKTSKNPPTKWQYISTDKINKYELIGIVNGPLYYKYDATLPSSHYTMAIEYYSFKKSKLESHSKKHIVTSDFFSYFYNPLCHLIESNRNWVQTYQTQQQKIAKKIKNGLKLKDTEEGKRLSLEMIKIENTVNFIAKKIEASIDPSKFPIEFEDMSIIVNGQTQLFPIIKGHQTTRIFSSIGCFIDRSADETTSNTIGFQTGGIFYTSDTTPCGSMLIIATKDIVPGKPIVLRESIGPYSFTK